MRISKIGLVLVSMVLAAGCANEAIGDGDDAPPVRTDQKSKKDNDDNAPSSTEGTRAPTSVPSTEDTTPPPPPDPPRNEDPPATPTDPPAPPTLIVTNVGFKASSRCIDAPATMSPGDKLIAWPCHLESNQRFSLSANGMLKSKNGNCVDLPANKDQPILWMCHGGPAPGDNQRWHYDGNTLRAMNKCLAVRGETVVMETCNGSAAQKWSTVK